MHKVLSFFALSLVLLSASVAGATVVIQFDVDALTTTSDVVVVAQVESRQSRWVGRRIVTDYDVRVTLPVAGAAKGGAHLTVRIAGGRVGDLAQVIKGVPGFVVGENVLLFLERNGEHGLLRVVGMAQGRFVLQRDPGGQVWVEQDLTGLALAKVTGENAKGKKTTSLVGPVQPVRMELRRMLVEVGQALKRVDLQLHPDVQEKLGPRLDHAYDFSFELGEVKR